ncbi:MAG: hypothetical protein AB1668_07100 [Nanoarchaeota archaeon]
MKSIDEIEQSRDIVRMTETAGWQEVKSWIENRISILNAKILTLENNLELSNVQVQSTKQGTKKFEIVVLNINKDKDKYEIMTWRMFLSKIADWEKLAREGI